MGKRPGRWLGLFLYPASLLAGSHPLPPLHRRRRRRRCRRLDLHLHSRRMVSVLDPCR